MMAVQWLAVDTLLLWIFAIAGLVFALVGTAASLLNRPYDSETAWLMSGILFGVALVAGIIHVFLS